MAIFSGFFHRKWWFSIAMLNHQRVLVPLVTLSRNVAGNDMNWIWRYFTHRFLRLLHLVPALICFFWACVSSCFSISHGYFFQNIFQFHYFFVVSSFFFKMYTWKKLNSAAQVFPWGPHQDNCLWFVADMHNMVRVAGFYHNFSKMTQVEWWISPSSLPFALNDGTQISDSCSQMPWKNDSCREFPIIQ